MSCIKLFFTAVVIVVLAWLFRLYPWPWHLRHRQIPPPVSYDGRITFNTKDLREPTTHSEIKSIVKEAYDNNRKVRVLADGHSWSEIAQSEDILISLHQYSGLVGDVDTGNMEVTVRAGTALSELSSLLESKGYAMINLGSVAGQSLAGAISTATHGTGIDIGNLAALVTKLKFVDGTGKDHVVGERDEDENSRNIFKAAQVSIGMLGVLSEVTIKIKEKFYLRELRNHYPLSYCLDNLDQLVKTDEYSHVKLWLEFYNDFCVLYQTNQTNNELEETPSCVESFIVYYTFAVATRICYIFPSLTPTMMRLVDYIGFGSNSSRTDISYRIFNDYFDLPIHQESEIIVNYEDTVPAILALKQVIIDNSFPVNYITEVRFVKGDDIWLSPYYGMENGACAITLTIYGPEHTVNEYFDAYYQATRQFGGRVHWGKIFTIDQAVVSSWYEKFPDFAAIRKVMDPKGIFLNPFLQNTFGFDL